MKTLHDRINRIAYVVINVSDLERSRHFYETVVGFRVTAQISAPTQSFKGLGIEQGRFEGLVMQDRTGGNPTAVHLVQWIDPAPVGTPYPVFWHVGLAKIAVVVPDVEAKIAIVREQGLRPTNPVIRRRYLSVLDPDGTVVSMPESPLLGTEQMTHTHVSTVDLATTNDFYHNLFGLPLRFESVPCEPQPASQGPGSDVSQWDSHLFSSRGDARFHIDVSHIRFPAATPDMLTPYAEANHLGIVRVGFEVDDLDASRAILLEDPRATDVGEPEVWDYGAALGTRRVVTLRDPNGIRLELVQEKPVQPQQGCQNSAYNPAPIEF